MIRSIKLIGKSFQILKQDKWILLFSLLPVGIGVGLYSVLWNWIFGDLLIKGNEWIQAQISSSGWSSFLYYIFAGMLGIFFWFLLSWTFVLFVSLVASPFNDLISSRVEKIVYKKELPAISESFSQMLKGLAKTLGNEIKKILFIVSLSIIAFGVSFIPVLIPLSFFISSLLMAVSFLDYSWSRHNFNFKTCMSDIRSSLLAYAITGAAFFVLVSVPLINLLTIPMGTIFYTMYFCEKRLEIK